MISLRKSIVIGFVALAAVAAFALFAVQGSRALAQAQGAKALDAQARVREATARAQAVAAAEAKAQAVKAQAAATKLAAVKAADAAKPFPLDLSKHLQMKAENFKKSKAHPWPAVPTGAQTFAGIPVNIQGSMMTFGQRNADNGLKYPETITGIPCRQKFETLYIVHSAFYAGATGEPAFEVVLNYPGDEKQTDAILCGEDARDWYIREGEETLGPSAKRSTLAWTGTGKSGMRDQAVRFCITAIENKYPDRLVETIDLLSAKNQTAGCILAITVGKSGLLKPKPEKPADPSQPKDE